MTLVSYIIIYNKERAKLQYGFGVNPKVWTY